MKVLIKKEYLNRWSPIIDEIYEVNPQTDISSSGIYTFTIILGCFKYPKYKKCFGFHPNWLIIIEQ